MSGALARGSHDSNAQTFSPIPVKFRAEFLTALDLYRPKRSWPIPPVQLVRFLYEFGPHPEVIAHPRGSGIQVFDGRVLWHRPKTNKPVGTNGRGILIPEPLEEWVPGFVRSLKEPETHRVRRVAYYVDGTDADGRKLKDAVLRYREQDFCSEVVSYEVATVCEDLAQKVRMVMGVSMEDFGHITARTLRHTYLNRVWMKTRSLRAVMDAGAVNKADAELYCVENPEDSGLDAAMRNSAI